MRLAKNVIEATATPSNHTRQLFAACAGMLALVATLSAQAAFVITGGSAAGWPASGNDFTGDLENLGYNQMTTRGQLSVDMDGTVTFYYIAAESSYTNSFTGSSSMTEANHSFNWDGWSSFSIDVSSGDVLDFNFNSTSAKALSPVDNFSGSNLEGLGIMSMSSKTSTDLVLAYNDNYLGYLDSDFDDMLVRAKFSSTVVPVPAAAWLFSSGLLGLIGMARRRKQ
jgi:hypothetical protein